jgi:dolichol-phosphate mannosyltransferase
MHRSSFSIICCFYNEINILKTKFFNFLNDISNIEYEYEIIICDNNSNDGTTEYLKDLEKKNPKLKFIFNSKNLGKGGSIKEAIKYSTKQFMVIFDIDEYFLDDLLEGFKKIQEQNNIDFLIGNRIHDNNQFIYKKNFYGVKFISSIFNILYSQKIRDTACATKIFKKKFYDNYNFTQNEFDYEFEVLSVFAKNKAHISEFDVDYNPRTFKEGKKLRAFKDGSMILQTILKSYFKNNE